MAVCFVGVAQRVGLRLLLFINRRAFDGSPQSGQLGLLRRDVPHVHNHDKAAQHPPEGLPPNTGTASRHALARGSPCDLAETLSAVGVGSVFIVGGR